MLCLKSSQVVPAFSSGGSVSPDVMKSCDPSSQTQVLWKERYLAILPHQLLLSLPRWIWTPPGDSAPLAGRGWTEGSELCRVYLCPSTCFSLLASERPTVGTCFWVSYLPRSCSRQESETTGAVAVALPGVLSAEGWCDPLPWPPPCFLGTAPRWTRVSCGSEERL